MTIISLFSHPVTQIISFCIILVGSPYFGGPYGFFLYHAFLEVYPFAIIGVLAIGVTLISLFFPARGYMQLAGLLLMIASLAVFFLSSQNFMNAAAIREVLPLLTLLLFITVAVLVTKKVIDLQK